MYKLLIIQEKIPTYRIKLFSELSKHYDLTVLSREKLNVSSTYDFNYYQYKSINFISLYINFYKIDLHHFDCIIAPHDIRLINNYFMSSRIYRKLIFWGHGYGLNKEFNCLRVYLAKKSSSLLLYNKLENNIYNNSNIATYYSNNTIYVDNYKNYSNQSKRYILYTGRLQKRKGLDCLIKIFHSIHDKLPPNTKLKILGDGKRVLIALRELSAKLGISDKIEFIKGTKDSSVLAEHFKSAYCYASPGHVGLGVLHSFSYGVPVVTYKNRNHAPEASNIEDGVNGIFVEGGEKEFGESLLKLINSGSYISMGDKAFDHYSNYRTIDNMVDSFRRSIQYCLHYDSPY